MALGLYKIYVPVERDFGFEYHEAEEVAPLYKHGQTYMEVVGTIQAEHESRRDWGACR